MEQPRNAGRVAELIGLAAVVASLVFVGVEVRQSAAATRGATQQQLAAAAREVTLALTMPDMAELLTRGDTLYVSGDLSEADALRLEAFYLATFRVYEDAFYQFGVGNLDPEIWAGWRASMSDFALSLPGFRVFWSQSRNTFHSAFRASIDAILDGT